jgi:lysozyme family protein
VWFGENGLPVPGRTGYVNHPDDPGGETNYGITRETANAYGHTGPMNTLPYELVQTIYKEGYWDEIMGDENPSQDVAAEMFDTAVNCGPGTVIRHLQRALNVLNNKGQKYADIVSDGEMGPKTMTALKAALKLGYRPEILKALNAFQGVRYMELAETNERMEAFVLGWLRARVN